MSSFADQDWAERFEKFLATQGPSDAAHDPGHIRRVVTNARRLAASEQADWTVVMPAAWLHDCVHVPKSSPDRTRASRLAADCALTFLKQAGWSYGRLDEIAHAIEAHSFSAGIPPETLEAKVLQDADRIDALGAIGLARTLMLGGELKRDFYSATDPFCERREPDDSIYTLDHVYRKLLTLEDTMQTPSGRIEAHSRTAFLREFLAQLGREMDHRESAETAI